MMNSIDLKSLEIESLIRNYIKNKDYQDIELVGVFFHELMIYAINCYIIKNSQYQYNQNLTFPFLNSDYVNNPEQMNFKKQINRIKNNKYKLIEMLQQILPIKKSIVIEDNVSIDISSFVKNNLLKYKIKQSINNKIFVNNQNEQLAKIKQLLNEIANLLDINNNYFISNFINYIKSYLTNKPIKVNSDILIVGSNAKLTARINSAIFLSEGKKVISLCHGEHSSYILDEPIIGYGELSYCSDYITYGKNQDFNKLVYAKPLYSLPKIHHRNSDFIKGFYSTKTIKHKKIDKNMKILYIPTLFSGNQRYGPFRDIEDNIYKKWQENILSLDVNITYKAHPKSKVELNLNYHKINTRNLKEVLLDYDLYILDYISTASALCVATDKPIIYFNLGMRNVAEDALELFKKRVFWIDVDIEKDFNIQIKNAIEKYNNFKKQFINEYTKKYSLSDHNKLEIESLVEIVEGIDNVN